MRDPRYLDAQRLMKQADSDLRKAAHLLRQLDDQHDIPTISQHRWKAQQMLRGGNPRWFSQAGQDRFLDEMVFKGLRAGRFAEVGGYDGISGSNCLFFELIRGWQGLIVEASPTFAAKAKAVRQAPVIEVAVGRSAGEMEFIEVTGGYTQMSGLTTHYNADILENVRTNAAHKENLITVPVKPLADILSDHGFDAVDYVSLDVEGAEMDVLMTFPFDDIPVMAWSIENNTSNPEIAQLMAANGYQLAARIGVDEIHVRRDKA